MSVNSSANIKVDTLYQQSIDGCLTSAIDANGLSSQDLSGYLDLLTPHLAALRDDHARQSLELLRISERVDDIEAGERALQVLMVGAETVVFFGTGGSGLGGQTLAQLAGWNIPGAGGMRQQGKPRTRFYDNLDGATLAGALAGLDLSTSRFVVTSKSGGTAETLAQAIAAISAVCDAGLENDIPKMFLGITEPAVPGRSNGLRSLFSDFGIPMLDHPTGIGGRYSCLTMVGLLPAMARGLDVRAIRKGAQSVIDNLLNAPAPKDFAPAVGAATAVAMNKLRGVRTLVMMPYADKLGRFASWYVQLWAESLGKGGEGTTPIGAQGPLDQHSQLQLFMDGPREHMLTVMRVPTAGIGPVVDSELARRAGLDMLAGRTVGDVVAAQAGALPEALRQAGRPVRTIDIPQLNEESVGALLMHFMIETILAGRLLGVDPFDQPAVELAKVLTKQRLAETAS